MIRKGGVAGEAQSYGVLLFRFVLSELPALFVDQWSAAAKCDMESGQLPQTLMLSWNCVHCY